MAFRVTFFPLMCMAFIIQWDLRGSIEVTLKIIYILMFCCSNDESTTESGNTVPT